MVGEKIEIECRVRYSIKYDNRLIDWYGVVEKIHDRRVGNKFFDPSSIAATRVNTPGCIYSIYSRPPLSS